MTTRTGIALRSTVFSSILIPRIASEVDGTFDSAWLPDVNPTVDPFDLCGLALGATKRLVVGTGVIRPLEHNPAQLAERVEDLSRSSGNRLILGVGTGRLRGRTAVNQLVALTSNLRSSHPSISTVPIYFAALGPRMVRAAFKAADGVLLNFCSPEYASAVISQNTATKNDGFRVACYVKLFFAEAESEARRMLSKEFVHYDSIPQYHSMFESMGVSAVIQGLRGGRAAPEENLTGKLSEISMSNPTKEAVLGLLQRFREAGVDTPVVYPYAKGTDDYKLQLVKNLRDWLV